MKNYLLIMTVILAVAMGSCNEPTERKLQKVDIKEITDNTVKLFNDDWGVVTAGDGETFNPMTISWGGLGVLWGYPVATIYIRNTRYTYQFLEDGNYFTICVFDENYRETTQYWGTVSGRDEDKIQKSKLTPVKTDLGNLYFEEARLVIECEKIYADELSKDKILDEKAQGFYAEDYHVMFVGKIINVWEKK